MTQKASLHFRLPIEETGYTRLVSPDNSALEVISLDVLRLNQGENYMFAPGSMEKALIILCGTCSVTCEGYKQERVGARESVFDGPASAVYVPPHHELALIAETYIEIAVVKAPTDKSGLKPQIIHPSEVKGKVVGRGNWLRYVYDVVASDFLADRLIVGETINPPGNWSSSPPHKHDRHNPPFESQFEEVYMYRLSPDQGFGLQRVYTAEGNVDNCYVVQHNDIVVLPRGYHPVVACPGYKLYYLWVLAGQGRSPVWFEDPAHKWIHESKDDE